MKENVTTNNSFIALQFCSVCVLLTVFGCIHSRDNEVSDYLTNRVILERDRWPSFLLGFENAASVPEATTKSLVVYQIDHDEYLFRCDDSDTLFALFSSRWELSMVEENLHYVKKFQTRIPKSYISDDNEFFANPNRQVGEKGPQIVVCRSPSRRSIVGHYYFNF